jgi:hypothetical protein
VGDDPEGRRNVRNSKVLGGAVGAVLFLAGAGWAIGGATSEVVTLSAPVPDVPAAAASEADAPVVYEAGDPLVCEHAELNASATGAGPNTEAQRMVDTLTRACEQARAGDTVDRPDVVECFERADRAGTIVAGEIPQESCELVAMDDTPTDDLNDLVRANHR